MSHTIPTLQPLEPRQLLAGGAFLLGRTLIVTGSSGDDVIFMIHASPEFTSPINVTVNGHTRSFPAARVARILVSTGAGNDRVRLGYGVGEPLPGAPAGVLNAHVGVPTVLWGGAGDDWIIGGGGKDTIVGGTGNDRLDGNYGDDFITGNEGNDTLHGAGGFRNFLSGGAGNDSLFASGTADTVFGDAGDDRLAAYYGNHHLHGGAGNDTIESSDGNERISGGPGNDLLRRSAYDTSTDEVTGVETVELIE